MYVGKTAKNHVQRIKRKLRAGKAALNVYVICLAKGANQLEIFNSIVLLQPYYKKEKILVFGVAQGMEEAQEVILEMLNDSIANGYHADIKAFLEGI